MSRFSPTKAQYRFFSTSVRHYSESSCRHLQDASQAPLHKAPLRTYGTSTYVRQLGGTSGCPKHASILIQPMYVISAEAMGQKRLLCRLLWSMWLIVISSIVVDSSDQNHCDKCFQRPAGLCGLFRTFYNGQGVILPCEIARGETVWFAGFRRHGSSVRWP